tara:strand:+ start:269 stop:643 length:375 start_codon:yes stop_codon:yes gene_type:complete
VSSTSISKEKKAAIKRLAERACSDAAYNPFDVMIEIATATEDIVIKDKVITVHTATRPERIAIAKEIAGYIQPKIKSTETEEKSSPTFVIQVQTFGGGVSETAIKVDETRSVSEDETVQFTKLG